MHAELGDWSLAQSLDHLPLDEVELRHTIGMLDPLRRGDIAEAARLDDGLPESLEDNIQRYGMRWFKVSAR